MINCKGIHMMYSMCKNQGLGMKLTVLNSICICGIHVAWLQPVLSLKRIQGVYGSCFKRNVHLISSKCKLYDTERAFTDVGHKITL